MSEWIGIIMIFFFFLGSDFDTVNLESGRTREDECCEEILKCLLIVCGVWSWRCET